MHVKSAYLRGDLQEALDVGRPESFVQEGQER